jgi:hypothetical protein
MNFQLYTLPASGDMLVGRQGTTNRQISALGSVGSATEAGGSGVATPVSVQPGDRALRGSYRGKDAELMAAELRELAEASGLEEIPLAARDQDTDADGYYSVQNTEVAAPAPGAVATQTYTIRLKRVGGRESHYRAVQTKPQSVFNDFGSTSEARIAVDARADVVGWLKTEQASTTTEAATPVATVDGEFATYDIYDATDSTFSKPALAHSLGYLQEEDGDVRVWDTRGLAKTTTEGDTVGSATVGSSSVASEVLQWVKVFAPSHQFRGELVVDTGRLRLRIDNDATVLRAERWDASAEAWSRVPLGDSTWTLTAADLRHIGQARVDLRLAFDDTASASTYALRARLARGLEDAQCRRALSESSAVPSGLQTLLDPIASPRDQSPAEQLDVIPREGVDT